jgi:hypothetical protein
MLSPMRPIRAPTSRTRPAFALEGLARPRHGCIQGPASVDPSPAWPSAWSASVCPCHGMGRSFPVYRCPRPAEGQILCPASMTASVGGAPAWTGGTHPCGSIGDRVARKHVLIPRDRHIHRGRWMPACTERVVRSDRRGRSYDPKDAGSDGKDAPIQGSRTPIGSHGYGQAGTRRVPSTRSRTPMRRHECQEAGTRKTPFAGCGYPWNLMAAGKRGQGRIPRGQGLWPWGPIDSRKRREGCTPSWAAPAHAPSSTRGSGRRVAAIHEEGLSRRALRTPHRPEGSTDHPDGRLTSRA